MNAWQGPRAPEDAPDTRRLRTPTGRIAKLLACGLAVAAIAGCAGRRPDTVTIHDLKFDPQTLTVAKGTTVTWVNKDQIPVQVQSDDFGAKGAPAGQFSSEPLNPEESYTLRFDNTGEFTYADPFHPYMKGTIIVK
jgi:plastocyanin